MDDGGDYLSLDQIQDKIPRYFCMDNIIRYNIIPYYLVTVTAGGDNRQFSTMSSDQPSPLVI